MSFLSAALTSGNLQTLRGTSSLAPSFTGRVNASLEPTTVIFAALVNQSSFGTSRAAVTFDTVTTGAYTDLRDGQTIYISPTTDLADAIFVGRVRQNGAGSAATSTVIYINENSAPLVDNYYIYVADSYGIRDRLGREVSGVLKMDYDRGFRQLRPLIYNLKSAYVKRVAAGDSAITLSFAPLALAVTSGASISTWAWEVGDGTITVGSSSTQNITATFPAGFRWIHLTVTDSGGRSSVRHIRVWSHDASYPPALNASDNIQVTADVATGYDATLTSFAGLDDVVDNASVVFWSEDTYQDGETSILGDNILGIFCIRKSVDSARNSEEQGVNTERAFTLESPLTQLARLEQLPFEILYKSSPTKWGEIKNATLWRDIVLLLSETTTFLDLHSLTFDDTSDTFLAPTRNTSGNVLESMNELAASMNAALQMNAAGECEIVRDAVMLSSSERDALVTAAEWTESDLLEITSLEHDHARTVGHLDATGGSYNSTTDLYTSYRSLAPGVAQESGEGSATLDKQVLAANQTAANARSELNARVGHAFEKAQPVDTLTVIFVDGHHSVLIPSRNIWHTFSLAATDTFPGIANTRRWLLVNVQMTHYNDGSKTVTAKFQAETSGAPGQTIIQPPSTGTPRPTPVIPAFNPNPAFGGGLDFVIPPFATITPIIRPDVAPRTDGNTIMTGTAAELWLVPNFLIGSAPDYRDIHPEPGAAVRGACWYPWSKDNKGALALVGDDSSTALYRTPNAFARPVVWTQGQVLTGVYDRLRALPGTAGVVYAAGNQTAPGECNLDLWQFVDGSHGINLTTGSDENGRYVQVEASLVGGVGYYAIIQTPSDTECCNCWDYAFVSGGATVSFFSIPCGSAQIEGNKSSHNFSGSNCVNLMQAQSDLGQPFTVKFYFNCQDDCCADDSNTAQSVYSEDYGDTFASPVVIASAALGGFDVGRKGIQVLGGGGTQAYQADTGSAYSTYGGTKEQGALHIPRFTLGSTTSSNGGTTPQYLLASTVVNGDTESLWKVTGGGATFADISPVVSGDQGVAAGPECLITPWNNGNIIVAVLLFGSTPRLIASTDGGSTWHASSFLNTNANYIRMRKSDTTRKQAFLNNMGPAYCKNIQVTTPVVYTRQYPSSDPIILIEPYGG